MRSQLLCEITDKQVSVGQTFLTRQKTCALRVPLNAQNIGSYQMFQGLDDPVFCCLGHLKVPANSAAALVMGAVYETGRAEKAGKEGRFLTLGRVCLILLQAAVALCRGQVLDQISAEIDVEEL